MLFRGIFESYVPIAVRKAQNQAKVDGMLANAKAKADATRGTIRPNFRANSEARILADRLKSQDIRTDKVAGIKSQIEAGTYEDDKKLDVAVSRLLDELVA